jgi:hypothetical protein
MDSGFGIFNNPFCYMGLGVWLAEEGALLFLSVMLPLLDLYFCVDIIGVSTILTGSL